MRPLICITVVLAIFIIPSWGQIAPLHELGLLDEGGDTAYSIYQNVNEVNQPTRLQNRSRYSYKLDSITPSESEPLSYVLYQYGRSKHIDTIFSTYILPDTSIYSSIKIAHYDSLDRVEIIYTYRNLSVPHWDASSSWREIIEGMDETMITATEESTYNDDGQLVNYTGSGFVDSLYAINPITSYNYYYSNEGLLDSFVRRVTQLNVYDKAYDSYRIAYRHNEDNQLVNSVSKGYKPDRITSRDSISYEYNEQGLRKKKNSYKWSSSEKEYDYESYITYEYDTENRLIIQTTNRSPNHDPIHTLYPVYYEYNENGDLAHRKETEWTVVRPWDDDRVLRTVEYIYDEDIRFEDVNTRSALVYFRFSGLNSFPENYLPRSNHGKVYELDGFADGSGKLVREYGYTYHFSEVCGTSVSEPILSAALTLSPNPASAYISIHAENLDPDSEITIYSLNGSISSKPALTDLNRIAISDLPAGVYLLSLENSRGDVRTGKFVKVDE